MVKILSKNAAPLELDKGKMGVWSAKNGYFNQEHPRKVATMNSAAACHEFGGDWEPQKTDFFRRPPEVEDDADGLYKLASDNEENYSVKSIKIHIVRHGVVHNPEKIFYGRITKHRLNADGEGQSRRVGAYLAANCPGIGAVYASPQQRAHETGLHIGQVLPI